MKSVYKKQAGTRTSARRLESNTPEVPLTYFNDGGEEGGGGPSGFLGSEILDRNDFLGL